MLILLLTQFTCAMIVLIVFLFTKCIQMSRRIAALEAHSDPEMAQINGALHQHLFERIRRLESRVGTYMEGQIN